jgi:hypothetical protein
LYFEFRAEFSSLSTSFTCACLCAIFVACTCSFVTVQGRFISFGSHFLDSAIIASLLGGGKSF